MKIADFNVSSTTKETEITLEDKDFLLITAINNLTNEIQKLRLSK